MICIAAAGRRRPNVILDLTQALYGGGLKYAKVLDLLGPGWIVELDKNASNSMGSALAGWRFGL